MSSSLATRTRKACNRNGYRLFPFAPKWAKIVKNMELLPTYCPLFSGLDDAVIVGRELVSRAGAVLVKQKRLS